MAIIWELGRGRRRHHNLQRSVHTRRKPSRNQSQREVWRKMCLSRWLVDPEVMSNLQRKVSPIMVNGKTFRMGNMATRGPSTRRPLGSSSSRQGDASSSTEQLQRMAREMTEGAVRERAAQQKMDEVESRAERYCEEREEMHQQTLEAQRLEMEGMQHGVAVSGGRGGAHPGGLQRPTQ